MGGIRISSSTAMGSGEQDIGDDPRQVSKEMNNDCLKHPNEMLSGRQVGKIFEIVSILENGDHSVKLMRVNMDLIL